MRSGKQSQGPDLLRADMEYTESRQTDNITGFRKVKGGWKCIRRDLSIVNKLRKVICVILTIREE